MNAEKTAQGILRYFADTQGKGHSRAVVLGAVETRANIVVTREDIGKRYGNILGRKMVSLDIFEVGGLNASSLQRQPLVLDNGAVVALLTGLLAEIAQGRQALDAITAKAPRGQKGKIKERVEAELAADALEEAAAKPGKEDEKDEKV